MKTLRLFGSWLLLLMLLVVEVSASFLPLPRAWRPLLMLPAVLMAAGVAILFMQLNRGPALIRIFVAAGIVWLIVLLSLGTLDPMTRTDYQLGSVSH